MDFGIRKDVFLKILYEYHSRWYNVGRMVFRKETIPCIYYFETELVLQEQTRLTVPP